MIRLDCSRISPYHSVPLLFGHTTAPLGLTGEGWANMKPEPAKSRRSDAVTSERL